MNAPGDAMPTRAEQRSKDAARRRLGCFLAISVCLHAGVLLAWKPSPDFTMVRGAVLSVSLAFVEPAADVAPVPAPVVEPPLQKRQAKQPQPDRRDERARASSAVSTENTGTPVTARPASEPAGRQAPPGRAETAPKPDPAPDPPTAATARAPLPDPADATGAAASRSRLPQETARAQVRELLLADLARYFEYPWLARRRGWQGMVWLSVTVQPDGALERVRVTRSSGYALLDRSAVETIQRVGQLAHAGRWLEGRALELPLPIVYRLTD